MGESGGGERPDGEMYGFNLVLRNGTALCCSSLRKG